MTPEVCHPLAPLTEAEQDRAVALVRSASELGDHLRFISIEAREPDKSDYLAWRDGVGPRPAREAFVVLIAPEIAAGANPGVTAGAARAMEVIVSLDDDRVVSHVVMDPEVQPAVHVDEFHLAGEIVRSDPGYRAALALRGVTDASTVHVEAWSTGSFEQRGDRLVRALAWVRSGDAADNPYARPLAGLVAVVDLNTMAMVRLDDHAPGTPPPSLSYPYHDGAGHPYRDDLRPLAITQPDGPSFTLSADRRLRWQKWDLYVGFHPREGLVVHDVAYWDQGSRRQICHRASICEMVIPYGDPNPTVGFKNVFDTGEYGMGAMTNSLSRGCDCLGEIRYLDVVTNTIDGQARLIPNGICIHEEDDNILWKHTSASGRVDRARARRLVVSTFATVGNYEYGYFWYFHQDGSWAFEAKLTGIVHTAGVVATAGVIDGERSPHSLPIADGVLTSAHQHFFCARLDLDVDGPDNVAFQVDSVGDPWGLSNPDGTAWREVRTTYERESLGLAQVSAATGRRFRVENVHRRNRIGDPVCYELVPGENVGPMAQPDSTVRARARMLDHHLWVTPYRREERYPAGEYPNQSQPGEGLPAWTAADRDLADRDVVFWYTFGAHHFPRLEDWPVMPVVKVGFHLRPVGFFDYNPALDVPPPNLRRDDC